MSVEVPLMSPVQTAFHRGVWVNVPLHPSRQLAVYKFHDLANVLAAILSVSCLVVAAAAVKVRGIAPRLDAVGIWTGEASYPRCRLSSR
jgi:hypothetical protein